MLDNRISQMPQLILASGLGVLLILILSGTFHIFYKVYEHFLFLRYMTKIGYPPADNISILSFALFISKHIEYRDIGRTWFSERFNIGLVLFSFVTLSLGVLRALETGLATEFQRLGAIVVIVGIFSLINERREALLFKSRWRQIEVNTSRESLRESVQRVADLPDDFTKRKAASFNLLLTAVGTIVWAYGDQLIGCSLMRDIPKACELLG